MLYKLDEKEILLEYIELERYEAAQKAAKEVAKEATIQMLKEGQLSVEQIANYFSNLTVDDVRRIQKDLLQSV